MNGAAGSLASPLFSAFDIPGDQWRAASRCLAGASSLTCTRSSHPPGEMSTHCYGPVRIWHDGNNGPKGSKSIVTKLPALPRQPPRADREEAGQGGETAVRSCVSMPGRRIGCGSGPRSPARPTDDLCTPDRAYNSSPTPRRRPDPPAD